MNLKPIFTFLAALLLAPPPARADLVAHFCFEGDLKDATGQHNGRPVDPKLAPSFAPGRAGKAVVIEKVNAASSWRILRRSTSAATSPSRLGSTWGTLARPATIPRARVAETGPKAISYH
jgi:hypothetical protein